MLLLIAGCGNAVSPLVTSLRDQVRSIGDEDTYGQLLPDTTPDVLAQFDFSVLYVEVPVLRDETYMRPIETNTGVETWIGAQGAALYLSEGIVRATRGYGFDLAASERPDLLALRKNAALGTTYGSIYRHWGADEQLTTRRATCTARATSDGIEETCLIGKTRFTNAFAIKDNSVIASTQWVGEGLGYVKTQLVSDKR
jgi:hypothetical protein